MYCDTAPIYTYCETIYMYSRTYTHTHPLTHAHTHKHTLTLTNTHTHTYTNTDKANTAEGRGVCTRTYVLILKTRNNPFPGLLDPENRTEKKEQTFTIQIELNSSDPLNFPAAARAYALVATYVHMYSGSHLHVRRRRGKFITNLSSFERIR